MKYLTILFLFLVFKIYCQNDTVFIRKNIKPFSEKIEYKTDTIVFTTPNARNILISDAILTQTKNQQIAKGYGLFFEKFEVKECEKSEKLKSDKIISVKKEKDQWIIKIIAYSNCCQDFLADIKVEKNETLNLIYYNYGMYCSCSCPFEVTYTIRIMSFDSLKNIKSVIINGNYSTKKELEK